MQKYQLQGTMQKIPITGENASIPDTITGYVIHPSFFVSKTL
jgi:hypothetical protein